MKKCLFSAFGLVFALPLGVQAQSGVIPTVANPFGASSLLLNPAAMATKEGAQAFLGFNAQGGELLLTTPGIALGYQRIGLQDVYHLASAYNFKSGFSLGAAYRSNGGVELSGLYRPFDFLSVGLTSTLVNPTIRFGIGVRPLGDRLTLTADTSYANGQYSNSGLFGAEWEPTDGLFLRGTLDTSGIFGIGVGVRTPHFGGGYFNRQGHQGYLTYSQAVERAVFKSEKGQTADLKLDALLNSANTMFSSDVRPPVYPVIKAIEDAQKDPEIGTLRVQTEGLDIGLADAEEIRAALLAYRASGKKAVGYLSGADTLDYYIMSACDRIVLAPLGELELLGLAMQHTSYKGLMDLLGIRATFLPIGRYKSAGEPFTRKNMSEANRQQWNQLLDDDYNRIVGAIATARNLPRTEVTRLIDRGLFSSQDALQAKLVDELAYPEEQSDGDAGRRVYRKEGWAPRPKIAIISAMGDITSGQRNPADGIGSETLSRALKEARENPEVSAVVFYINSGGGSAIASEEIRNSLALLRAKKPIVTVMGNVAASGGYWIALENNRLLAQPSTLTGSIGVIQGKIDFAGTLNKLGINMETLKRGEKADLYSIARGLTPAEEKTLNDLGFFYYQKFTDLVANKRNLSSARVMELAGGRVYTGNQALGLSLVDQLGGLQDGINEAKRISGVKEAEYVFLPKIPSLLELLLK